MTRIGELFAGYGGLGMGVQQVYGGEVAWYSEFDAAPSKIMAHHHPDVPNLGDITAVDWSQVEPVDILTGGYPCQPFSLAGRRAGTDDVRHLWPYVVEAANTLRPAVCVFENVQGHLSLGFDVVLSDLKTLGYEVTWTLISASSVGAPHRRNRLFILATRSDHDGINGLLRSWTDRRGGVHRDRLHGHDSLRAAEGLDGGQGPARAPEDGVAVRRESGDGEARGGELPRDMVVAPPREGGVDSDREAPLRAYGQGRAGARGATVPDDAARGTKEAERAGGLDRGDDRPCSLLCDADPGRESSGSGSRTPGSASRRDDVGRGDVGAAGGSVRSGGIPGEAAADRDDAIRAALFTPLAYGGVDLGADLADPCGGGSGGGSPLALAGGEGGADAPSHGPNPGLGTSGGAPRLMPTPVSQPSGNTPEEHLRKKPGREVVTDLSIIAENGLWETGGRLLPTPGANLGENGGPQHPDKRRAGGHSVSIEDAVHALIPTPSVADAMGGHERRGGARGDELLLKGLAKAGHLDRFGPYAPAISRWEQVLGRPAPDPTEPGRTRPRLSAAFVEFLMGLPDGHVTAVPGLTRNQQLKALGNGVVTQQCAAALTYLHHIRTTLGAQQ